jgi:hypothetical protein
MPVLIFQDVCKFSFLSRFSMLQAHLEKMCPTYDWVATVWARCGISQRLCNLKGTFTGLHRKKYAQYIEKQLSAMFMSDTCARKAHGRWLRIYLAHTSRVRCLCEEDSSTVSVIQLGRNLWTRVFWLWTCKHGHGPDGISPLILKKVVLVVKKPLLCLSGNVCNNRTLLIVAFFKGLKILTRCCLYWLMKTLHSLAKKKIAACQRNLHSGRPIVFEIILIFSNSNKT